MIWKKPRKSGAFVSFGRFDLAATEEFIPPTPHRILLLRTAMCRPPWLTGGKEIASLGGFASSLHHFDKSLNRHGSGEQEPLTDIASKLPQSLRGQLVLDPFRDHRFAERAGHRDCGFDDRAGFVRCAHRGNEAAVDFQLTAGHLAKIGKRRMTGAEVVYRERNALFR